MANYSYTIPEGDHKGETLWSGRYCCIATRVILVDPEGTMYLLVNQRGPKTPNYQGKWNLPCGFLEDNETGEEGAVREILEETGIIIDPSILILNRVQTDPKEDIHVTLHYDAILIVGKPERELNFPYQVVTPDDIVPPKNLDSANQGEVSAIKWINKDDYAELEYAFNHKEIITNFFNK